MNDFGGGMTDADIAARNKRLEASIREQRRYEIAKAVMAGFAANMSAQSVMWHAPDAIEAADALLAQLDKPAP